MPLVAERPGLLDPPATRAGELRVEVRDGPDVIARHVLTGHAVIGRSADAGVRLDRGTVSRQHAELVCDPFGRWWIRDLNSRNGLVYDGRRVAERAVRSGDVYQVGDFTIRLLLADPPADPSTNGYALAGDTAVPVGDADAAAQSISTPDQLEPPRVAAAHLSMLLETGRELMAADQPDARLVRLLQLMLRPDFKGTCAMALRVDPGRLEAPQAIVPVQVATGHGGLRPPVSRSLLRTVLERNAPAMAANAGPVAMPADMVEMSMVASVRPLCAVACPLRQLPPRPAAATGSTAAGPTPAGPTTAGPTDVLYVIFPAECATGEWLAVAALAAEQYRLAESAWAARHEAMRHAAVERDLEQGRQIQAKHVPRGLVLPGLEVAVGFQPCRWVAGDYADALRLPDGRVFLAVADVCGKGLAAAMIASSLHTLVRAMLDDGEGLERTVARLNRHLVAYIEEGRFATMVAAVVDPATGAVEHVNFGHPPILVVDRDGTDRELGNGGNLPMGIRLEPVEVFADRLEPGQMLAMYSDGVSEARTTSGDMLGVPSLREELRATHGACLAGPLEAACERVAAWIESATGGRLQDDDRTYLLARRA